MISNKLGFYVGSTEHDLQVRIDLAWTAVAKLKSILKSPKQKLNFEIHLFKAGCISILLYGCDTWILTEALAEKLDILARACYHIKLGIKQSRDHVTNERLYEKVNQVHIKEMINSQVIVSLCLMTSPSTALPYTNLK